MLETPKSLRYHIGIFGPSNSGKSSLFNLLCDQEVSLVSKERGTTTDPVYKNIEIDGVGASTLIDTAGSLDSGKLGQARLERTKRVIKEIDCILYLLSDEEDRDMEHLIEESGLPCIYIAGHLSPEISVKDKPRLPLNKDIILEEIAKVYRLKGGEPLIFDGLLREDDQLFLLVMPQDQSAPKGRLILPQVQVIRELLDRKKKVLCISEYEIKETLDLLGKDPDWIITDSQVFHEVYQWKPEKTKLTSFSVLLARSKGQINILLKGTQILDKLDENGRVLISEACSHAPKEEDIGRVKIPSLLRKKIGAKLQIDFSRGLRLPADLEDYDLVIFCGSCMFTHGQVMARIEEAHGKDVPVSNYGLTIAHLNGILDKVSF